MKSEKRIRSNKLLKFIEKQAGKPAMMGLAFPYEYIIINDYWTDHVRECLIIISNAVMSLIYAYNNLGFSMISSCPRMEVSGQVC